MNRNHGCMIYDTLFGTDENILRRMRCAPGALPGLSLAVGVSAVRALRALGTACRSAYS